MKLIRVLYGKKDTLANMREYRIDGKGPVGTIPEYIKHFPNETFEVVDLISNDLAQCGKCGVSVEEGEICPICGVYMPSADDLADEAIRQIEAYDDSLEDE